MKLGNTMSGSENKGFRKWYEKCLPFVARGPELQLEWLVNELQKNILSPAELAPYVKLLLADNSEEDKGKIRDYLTGLDDDLICQLLESSEIYDTPKLFELIPQPNSNHADIALRKSVPPYEKKPLMLMDKIYYAVYNRSERLLKEAAEQIMQRGNGPEDFAANYQRFMKILEDEEFLLTLYPNARH